MTVTRSPGPVHVGSKLIESTGVREERAHQIRESIVAAATVCLADGGLGSDRLMSAVAREAGVSRPTVYRYFPAFVDLRDTVVQRELAILVDKVLPMIDELTWTEDAVGDLLAYVVSYARRHPLFVAALRDVPDQVMPLFTVGAEETVSFVRSVVGPRLKARVDKGAIPKVNLDVLLDVLARLALSLAFTNTAVPVDDPKALRRYLRDTFALVRLLN